MCDVCYNVCYYFRAQHDALAEVVRIVMDAKSWLLTMGLQDHDHMYNRILVVSTRYNTWLTTTGP
jgi:hypothetical protein